MTTEVADAKVEDTPNHGAKSALSCSRVPINVHITYTLIPLLVYLFDVS